MRMPRLDDFDLTPRDALVVLITVAVLGTYQVLTGGSVRHVRQDLTPPSGGWKYFHEQQTEAQRAEHRRIGRRLAHLERKLQACLERTR